MSVFMVCLRFQLTLQKALCQLIFNLVIASHKKLKLSDESGTYEFLIFNFAWIFCYKYAKYVNLCKYSRLQCQQKGPEIK